MSTAMQRMKTHFEKINEYFGKPLDLNKSSAKHYYYGFQDKVETKGVKSDFIRIYKIEKNNIFETSFAFSFKEPENYEKTLVSLSIKTKSIMGEEIINGGIYNIEEVKIKIKEFIRTLELLKKLKKYDIESKIETIKTIFEFDKTNLKSEEIYQKAKEDLLNLIKNLNDEYITKEKENKEIEKDFKEVSKKYNRFETNLYKKLKIEELEEQLKEAKNEYNLKLKDKDKELGYTNLINKNKEIKFYFNTFNSNKRSTISNFIQKFPVKIIKELEIESQKNFNIVSKENKKRIKEKELELS